MTLLLILVGVIAWVLIGVLVLSAHDNDDKELYRWYISGPFPLLTCLLVLLLWPLVLAAWLSYLEDPNP